MNMVVAGIMVGVNKIWLTCIAHTFHKFAREVGKFSSFIFWMLF